MSNNYVDGDQKFENPEREEQNLSLKIFELALKAKLAL